jgi:hypothetical protein
MTNRPVTIYISAAADLMAEREALAQMIAKLPVTLAWHIVQTPQDGELVNTTALQVADLFVLVMGTDIRAPTGTEWHLAQQAQRQGVAFVKQGALYTPAGQVFIRQAGVTWRPFTDTAHLSRQVQQLIVEHLIVHAIDYALTPIEVAELEKTLASAPAPQADEAKGAGHSAILISRERYMPGEGVIIGEDG